MSVRTWREMAVGLANVIWFEDLHVNGGMCKGCTATVGPDWDYSKAVHRDDCRWHNTVRLLENRMAVLAAQAREEGRRAGIEEAAEREKLLLCKLSGAERVVTRLVDVCTHAGGTYWTAVQDASAWLIEQRKTLSGHAAKGTDEKGETA